MKSVVVEIKGKFAAVLSDDGRVIKVRNRNYVTGQVIQMKETVYRHMKSMISGLWIKQTEEIIKMKKLHITKKLVLCAACTAIVLLCSGAGVWAYASPYSYVSLDVNPSIEYTLNRFERVINVKAVNDDGQAILDEIDIAGLNHKSIENAIMTTVRQISEEGYFTEGNSGVVTGSAIEITDGSKTEVRPVTGSAVSIDGGIIITVSSGNAEWSDELASEIREAVKDFVKENVEVEVSSVGLERVKEARELGVTPGKLNLVEKLKKSAVDPDSIIIEEWLDKPVKDIMKEIKMNRKATDTDDSEVTKEITASSSRGQSAAAESINEETNEPINTSEENDEADGNSKNVKVSDKGQVKSDKGQVKSDKSQVKSDKAEKNNGNTKEQLKEEIGIKQEDDKKHESGTKTKNQKEKEPEKPQTRNDKTEVKEQSKSGKNGSAIDTYNKDTNESTNKNNTIADSKSSTGNVGAKSRDKKGNTQKSSQSSRENPGNSASESKNKDKSDGKSGNKK